MIKISDSQRKSFRRCQRLWAYTKLLKIAPPNEDKWNLVFGSGVHEGLEQIHLQNTFEAAVAKCAEHIDNDPDREEDMIPLATAMLQGYYTHFYPSWIQQWKTHSTEAWFEYMVNDKVQDRGKRDLAVTAISDPNYFGIHDFKTTGSAGGGELARNLKKNVQLGQYSSSFFHEMQRWPNECGLIFLQKPSNKDFKKKLETAANDPSKYYLKRFSVDQEWCVFCIEYEKQVSLEGLQMNAIKDLYEQHGPLAMDYVPANFEGCFKYGRMCGFCDGCHKGKPAHTQIVDHRRNQ